MQDQYVTIQTNDDASLKNFVTELRNMNMTDSLNNKVYANPSKNYDTFIKLLQDAKDKHLPVRKIKFNKYKHKKNKWITRGILKSIKTKNKLYKVLRQTDTEDVEAFESIKIGFNRFHNRLRQSGVPQGSILGPFLFILNMNDICNVSDIFFTIMYADDTSLLVNRNDLHRLIALLNNVLKDLCTWFKSNKLSLNTNKTFYIIFHRSRIKCDTDSTLDIIMDNGILRKTSSLKYLGVIVD